MANLYIVATPIGNLADITLRALEVLKEVDLIAAEDTRHSQHLLDHYGIKTPLISLHQYNEQQRIAKLLDDLQQGKNIALISDAGTPLISDPGYPLIQAIYRHNAENHQAKIQVISIPGACAAIAALVAAGQPTDRFVFEGFLPVKTSARHHRLQELRTESRTLILYEAPHRIMKLLALMNKIFGDERKVTLARELTKRFETILMGTLSELQQILLQDPYQQKGEFVIVVAGLDVKSAAEEIADQAEVVRILKILLTDLSVKQAVALAAQICNLKRNELYDLALKLVDKKQDSFF